VKQISVCCIFFSSPALILAASWRVGKQQSRFRSFRVPHTKPLRSVAIIGTGISGLSAAWLLSEDHEVTVYEAERRIGGHSHTVMAQTQGASIPVDTGFIVYNEPAYPNLSALFAHLNVATQPTDMSFAVSLDGGRLEYAGTDLNGMFAQRGNLLRPRYWSMLKDLLRFYREAPREIATLGDESLDSYLNRRGYGNAFRTDHLYPMAAAIWSTPAGSVGAYPARSFVRFCENHGLLQINNRPIWRTVSGGSRCYVAKLTERFSHRILTGRGAVRVSRQGQGVTVQDSTGEERRFDQVALACHADQALSIIERPTANEQDLLSAFRYSTNRAVLHSDPGLMPLRRKAWCAWNYLADSKRNDGLCVTYWMNRLQHISDDTPLFVSLNPIYTPRPDLVLHEQTYQHPMFDGRAMAAQEKIWSLQGDGGLWFAGAYMGSGFHEDGIQAGLAVAEAISGRKRPWSVEGESARIHVRPELMVRSEQVAA
jgi:predicted NAD/FAD-binding protein